MYTEEAQVCEFVKGVYTGGTQVSEFVERVYPGDTNFFPVIEIDQSVRTESHIFVHH